MLSINIGNEKFTLDVITVRKLNQTMKFKKQFEIMQANDEQEAMIDAMIEYIVDVFSVKKGEEVIKPFDAEYILDNMPLGDLQKCFENTITAVLEVFGGEADTKK